MSGVPPAKISDLSTAGSIMPRCVQTFDWTTVAIARAMHGALSTAAHHEEAICMYLLASLAHSITHVLQAGGAS